ncbi:MAG: cbb3-type cytochrome c oxidase subunit I, partial [candidate division KSB1 bacterium]|nr:cbb3-type cytochrome c oxidase subunit I [candidate division KSB1 bacterium]
MSMTKLKWAAIAAFVVAMVILLGGGLVARRQLAPYPGLVTDHGGNVVFTREDILQGQEVYQRHGLMDHGSVWGHGSQRGPEFSAVTLHLIGETLREEIASREFGRRYADLGGADRELVDLKTKWEVKENRYDPRADRLVLTVAQTKALARVQEYWDQTLGQGDARYGFLPQTVKDAGERLQIARFFFWTAWVASVQRPGEDYSYTNNWPPDRSVGNVPTTSVYLWTLGGIFAMFVVLGLFIYWVHHYELWYGEARGVPLAEKLIDMPITQSQFMAAKFFVVVILLFLLQTSYGGLLAHYTVHPGSFWVSWIAKLMPYSWAKSWHLQLAIFWIATTWVASAIYLAPILGGREPKRQGLLVNILFVAVVVVAVGSLFGEVLSIKGLLGN